jgi:predicted RNase H-like HicB family nuclease
MLEQAEARFAVQVPDLAIVTHGESSEATKHAAGEAIRINLEAYRETGQAIPERQPITHHLENHEFQGLLFAYIEVPSPDQQITA